MCVRSSATRRLPGRLSTRSAIWFAIVAVGRNSAASWPRSSAARAWSSLTVGSSRSCSSPTSAAAIAARSSALGRLAVSERRSIMDDPSYRSRMDLDLLQQTLAEHGEPAYRARQVWSWAARGSAGYEAMTDVPAAVRGELAARIPFSTLTVDAESRSRDGTVKTLFRTGDGHPVEAVLMRYRDGRRSVCVSSQSGCPLTCSFCATG